MYVGMIETRSLKMLLKSFHENYSDLFIKITWYLILIIFQIIYDIILNTYVYSQVAWNK